MSNHKNLIDKINAGRFSEKECINLHLNAMLRDEVEVMEVIRLKMRVQYPRAANRIFGAKQNEAQSKLEQVLSIISPKFDRSKNSLKNYPKAGGCMLSGKFHIEQYISYKNDQQDGVLLSLTQKEIDSELFVTVRRYKSGKGGYSNEKIFNMNDFLEAVEEYTKELSTLLAA